MIGPLHAAMTATLLAMRIEIADFHALATTLLPIDRNIVFVHDYTFSPNVCAEQRAIRQSLSIGLYKKSASFSPSAPTIG